MDEFKFDGDVTFSINHKLDKLLRVSSNEREHNWVYGPFYLSYAKTLEEPPSSMVRVEFCEFCGLLRIQKDWLKYAGKPNTDSF